MKTFRAQLDPADLSRMADDLRAYAAKLRESGPKISERLAEVAAEEAKGYFGSHITVYADENKAIALGDYAIFQEFGAGAAVEDPFPGGSDMTVRIEQGAYSDEHEGEYTRTGYQYWHFGGRKYTEVVPTHGMFHGMEKARAEAGNIAREVLNSD